jgi:hypothetical protein
VKFWYRFSGGFSSIENLPEQGNYNEGSGIESDQLAAFSKPAFSRSSYPALSGLTL